MDSLSRGERFRFLYRQGEGAIDRREWRRSVWPPVAIAVAATLLWLLVAPRQARDLAREGFIDLRVAAAYVYLIVYAFILLLCAVVEYFVSAKRFADRGKPPALAGLAPFSLFFAAAAQWYQPRSEGLMPLWLTWAFDAAAVAVVIWTIAELGFARSVAR
jgi:uncharacterized membrane protein YhaH (DUF805 family)